MGMLGTPVTGGVSNRFDDGEIVHYHALFVSGVKFNAVQDTCVFLTTPNACLTERRFVVSDGVTYLWYYCCTFIN